MLFLYAKHTFGKSIVASFSLTKLVFSKVLSRSAQTIFLSACRFPGP